MVDVGVPVTVRWAPTAETVAPWVLVAVAVAISATVPASTSPWVTV